MSGKGSRPRPFSVPQTTFDSNWDLIFNKDKNNAKDEPRGPNEDQDRKDETRATES